MGGKQKDHTVKEWTKRAGVKKLRERHLQPWSGLRKRMVLAMTDDYSKICEVGCGSGRAVEAFGSKRYVGVDINHAGIKLAKKQHPGCNFIPISWGDDLPSANLYLFMNVLLHISDDEVLPIIQSCTKNTKADVLVVESMCACQRWRSTWHPRDRKEYQALFGHEMYREIIHARERIDNHPYFIDYCLFSRRGRG